MKLPVGLQGRDCSPVFLTEPALGVSRQITRRKIQHWIHSHLLAIWWVVTSTQRLAQKLISDPSYSAKIMLLSFNRIHSRVVTGLLTVSNTLRRHCYIMWLITGFLCRSCGAEEETSVHILLECEALVALWDTYLGSFFLDPQDVKSLSLGAVWNVIKGTGLTWLGHLLRGTKGQLKGPTCIGTKRAWTHLLFYSIWFEGQVGNLWVSQLKIILVFLSLSDKLLNWILYCT